MTTTGAPRPLLPAAGAIAWRLTAFLLVWAMLLAGPLVFAQEWLRPRLSGGTPYVQLLVDSAACLTLVVALWVMRRFAGRSTTAIDAGPASATGHLSVGLVVGVVLMAMVVVVLAIAGTLHRVSIPAPSLALLAVVCLSTLVNAAAQELLFQGYVLPLFERYTGTRVALACTAALFLLAHGPAAFAHVLPGINLYLAGLLLGTAFLSTRSLWFSTGLHYGWNLLQGPILGLSVSGHDLGGWRLVDASGPSWITGGDFGPEGGIVATIVTLIGIAALWGYGRIRLLRVRGEDA